LVGGVAGGCELQAKKALIDRRNRSFLTSAVDSVEGEPSYRVHDLMHDMARNSIECPTSQDANQLGGLGLMLPIAHGEFLERYRERAQGHRWDGLPRDGYIHRHLTWHMVQANWLDEIHALMAMSDEQGNNAWFEACDRLGQPAIFVEDVARAWELAEGLYESEPTRAIVLQCRYALITATLNSLAANLPVEMMAEFVKHDFWTVEQAWAYVEQIPYQPVVADAIQSLAPYLTKSLLKAAFWKTESMYQYEQVHVLIELAKNDATYFPMALDAARLLNENHKEDWMIALSNLARINAVCLPEALAATRSLRNERDYDQYYRAIALRQISEIDAIYFPETLTVSRSIKDEFNQASAFVSLCELDDIYFPEALNYVRSIANENEKASLLVRLARVNNIYFAEALNAVRLLQSNNQKTENTRELLLACLAEINPEYFDEALAAARSLISDSGRAMILSRLAKIDKTLFCESLRAAKSQKYRHVRQEVLSCLSKIDSENFHELLDTSRLLQDESARVSLLINLAKTKEAYFDEALNAARYLDKDSERISALIDLVNINSSCFDEALALSRFFQDEDMRAGALTALAKINPAYFTEALASVKMVRDEYYKTELLRNLFEINASDIDKFLNITYSLKNNYNRSQMLMCMHSTDLNCIGEAWTAAQSIQHDNSRVTTLIHLSGIEPVYFSEALDAARALHDDYLRAEALSRLARIDQSYFHEALDAIRALPREYPVKLSSILSSLIHPDINDVDFNSIIDVFILRQEDLDLGRFLADLAIINVYDPLQLMNSSRSVWNEHERADVLINLSKHGTQDFLVRIWEEIQQFTDKTPKAYALGKCLTNFLTTRLLYADWCKCIGILAYRKRSELLEDIAKLYPVISHLGSETAMRGVVDAMNDVCSQWK
jgi:hypothetical protein